MKEIIETILGVLDKKESENFKEFLRNVPNSNAWYLISDYCIDDANKYNDVFTFSLLCNYAKTETIKDDINNLASKDLKKVKTVESDFMTYLNSSYLYHFSIVIPRKEQLLAALLNKHPYHEMIGWINDVYENTKKVDVEKVDYYNAMQKRLKQLSIEVNKSGLNIKLFKK